MSTISSLLVATMFSPTARASSVSLSASATQVAAGDVVDFTVDGVPSSPTALLHVQLIVDGSPGYGYCTWLPCTFTDAFDFGGTHIYRAELSEYDDASHEYVRVAISNPISVTWVGPSPTTSPSVSWTVSLRASKVAAAAGERIDLTAESSSDVGSSPYYIVIMNMTTGTKVVSCGDGTSCRAGVSASGVTWDFKAFLSDTDGAVRSGYRSSATVKVSWSLASPTASLSASADSATSSPSPSTSPDSSIAALPTSPSPSTSATAASGWAGHSPTLAVSGTRTKAPTQSSTEAHSGGQFSLGLPRLASALGFIIGLGVLWWTFRPIKRRA